MNKKIKVVIIAAIIIMLSTLANISNAANLKVDVNFDAKKIEMTSETPQMSWNINNLLPGETDVTYLTIENTGKKETKIKLAASLEEGKELAEILDLEIIKIANSNNEKDVKLFSGKYKDLSKLDISLNNKNEQTIKIVTKLPIEAGNEYQKKNCKIKLNLVAVGTEDIQTEEVNPPQTGESRVIYIVGGMLVIAVVVLVVSFWKKKKDK